MTRAWILLLLLLLGGCASVSREPTSTTFTQAELLDVMVRWREGERRRDAKMAQGALHFDRAEDRAFHRDELKSLRGAYAGPIRTAREFHLVGAPAGPGDYLFLEPTGHDFAATFVTIVAVHAEPRVVYRRPAVTERERAALKPADIARLTVQHRLRFWESLAGEDLAEEVARLRRLLRAELEAKEYARRHAVPLAPFEPGPQTLLDLLTPMTPEEARSWVLGVLGTAGN